MTVTVNYKGHNTEVQCEKHLCGEMCRSRYILGHLYCPASRRKPQQILLSVPTPAAMLAGYRTAVRERLRQKSHAWFGPGSSRLRFPVKANKSQDFAFQVICIYTFLNEFHNIYKQNDQVP